MEWNDFVVVSFQEKSEKYKTGVSVQEAPVSS